MSYDPNNPKDVEKAKKRSKNEQNLVEEFILAALSTTQGRAYFWKLIGDCGVYHNPFSPDLALMSFKAGEMNVGQKILSDILRVAPESYEVMMREADVRSRATSESDASSGEPAGFNADGE